MNPSSLTIVSDGAPCDSDTPLSHGSTAMMSKPVSPPQDPILHASFLPPPLHRIILLFHSRCSLLQLCPGLLLSLLFPCRVSMVIPLPSRHIQRLHPMLLSIATWVPKLILVCSPTAYPRLIWADFVHCLLRFGW